MELASGLRGLFGRRDETKKQADRQAELEAHKAQLEKSISVAQGVGGDVDSLKARLQVVQDELDGKAPEKDQQDAEKRGALKKIRSAIRTGFRQFGRLPGLAKAVVQKPLEGAKWVRDAAKERISPEPEQQALNLVKSINGAMKKLETDIDAYLNELNGKLQGQYRLEEGGTATYQSERQQLLQAIQDAEKLKQDFVDTKAGISEDIHSFFGPDDENPKLVEGKNPDAFIKYAKIVLSDLLQKTQISLNQARGIGLSLRERAAVGKEGLVDAAAGAKDKVGEIAHGVKERLHHTTTPEEMIQKFDAAYEANRADILEANQALEALAATVDDPAEKKEIEKQVKANKKVLRQLSARKSANTTHKRNMLNLGEGGDPAEVTDEQKAEFVKETKRLLKEISKLTYLSPDGEEILLALEVGDETNQDEKTPGRARRLGRWLKRTGESFVDGGVLRIKETGRLLKEDDRFRDSAIITGAGAAVRIAAGPMAVLPTMAVGGGFRVAKDVWDTKHALADGTLEGDVKDQLAIRTNRESLVADDAVEASGWLHRLQKLGRLGVDFFMLAENLGYKLIVAVDKKKARVSKAVDAMKPKAEEGHEALPLNQDMVEQWVVNLLDTLRDPAIPDGEPVYIDEDEKQKQARKVGQQIGELLQNVRELVYLGDAAPEAFLADNALIQKAEGALRIRQYDKANVEPAVLEMLLQVLAAKQAEIMAAVAVDEKARKKLEGFFAENFDLNYAKKLKVELLGADMVGYALKLGGRDVIAPVIESVKKVGSGIRHLLLGDKQEAKVILTSVARKTGTEDLAEMRTADPTGIYHLPEAPAPEMATADPTGVYHVRELTPQELLDRTPAESLQAADAMPHPENLRPDVASSNPEIRVTANPDDNFNLFEPVANDGDVDPAVDTDVPGYSSTANEVLGYPTESHFYADVSSKVLGDHWNELPDTFREGAAANLVANISSQVPGRWLTESEASEILGKYYELYSQGKTEDPLYIALENLRNGVNVSENFKIVQPMLGVGLEQTQ